MKNIFLSIILVSLFLSLTPALAYAICEGPIVPCGRDLNGNGQIDPSEQCQFCDIFTLINNIIKLILTCLTPAFAALMLVLGGGYLVIAGASPELFNKAKGIITAVVIGLVIIFVAWIFLNTLLGAIGVTEWTGLQNWWEVKCQ